MATRYWVGGTGPWNATSTANWSASSGGASGASAPTSADDVIFDTASSGSSYIVTSTSAALCRSFTVSGPSSGTVTFAGTGAPRVYGSILFSTPATIIWSNTGTIIFLDGTANSTITTNNVAMTCQLSFQRVTYSTTFGSNFTTSDALTLMTGAIDLASYTVTCLSVTNNSGSTRSLAFGTGKIVVTGTGTAYTQSVLTGLTMTGSLRVEASYSGASALTVNTGPSPTTSQAISLALTGAGTFNLSIQPSANAGFTDLDCTGHAGTIGSNAFLLYGNLYGSSASGFAFTGSISVVTFSATSGTKTINLRGATLDRPVTFDGVGGTWQLVANLSLGSTRAMTLNNGTLNLNGYLASCSSFTTGTGTKNITFNGGTLNITGSGSIAFNNAVPTGFTTTAGTAKGFIQMSSATAKTFVGGGSNYAATLVQAGAGGLTISGSNTFSALKNTTQPAPIVFTSSTTNTFTDDIKLKGSAGSLIVITASTAGTAATIAHTGSKISCDYISLKDNTASGTTPFYAGSHSTSVSNVTNWAMRPPPSANTEFLLMF